MGCDIHIYAQRRNEGGGYETIQGFSPFDWRSYGMFGFLADVRNYSAVTPLSEPRGLPTDMDRCTDDFEKLSDCHSCSWLSVEELAAFDYDVEMEDRRVTRGGNRRCTCDPGEGEKTTYREFLGECFFKDLVELQRIGAERVVFGFDS